MAKVTVIVPVYNTEKYLDRCMLSLVNQTLNDIEILVINDGSTDRSDEILRKYSESYPERVRVIAKENGGQAAARNLGIREAQGEYIGFADSDDYVDCTMFEKMLALITEKKADMVECLFYYMQEQDEKVKKLKPRGRVRAYKDQKDMLIDPQVSPWNKMFRKSILLDNHIFFPEGYIYEDTAFYIKTIPYIKKAAYLNEPLIYYFLRQTSTMNANKSKRVGDIFPVLSDILDFYHAKGFYDSYAEQLEYFCVKILFCSSLSRIGRVTNRVLEKKLLDDTFGFVSEKFPLYKKNSYFKGKTGIYIKMVTRSNSNIMDKLLGHMLKG